MPLKKDSFTVVLASADQKINVIKEVRAITGLGLKEAKEIVAAPKDQRRRAIAEANELKEKLKLLYHRTEIVRSKIKMMNCFVGHPVLPLSTCAGARPERGQNTGFPYRGF